MPRPFFNVINGGRHANNNLAIQECMISPKYRSFSKNLQVASEIYHTLEKMLHQKFGAIGVGDEGGFAPNITSTKQALDILIKAINKSGYKGKVSLAIDAAASEFFKNGLYHIDNKKLNTKQLTKFYLTLIKKYPLISIEDPFEQEDFLAFANLRKNSKIQIVGDDLTVTNVIRLKEAIKHKSISCLLLKVNQIGTVTQALTAVNLASKNGIKVMVSHRSGETTDTFIADLAVALGCGQIKAGAPARGERVAKYNQLLRIEEAIK